MYKYDLRFTICDLYFYPLVLRKRIIALIMLIKNQNNPQENKSEKLKARLAGDWQLLISKIKCKHFESKDSLDDFFIKEEFELEEPPQICGQTIEKISIENAIEQFVIEFKCNMDYYLNNQQEIENDLGRKIYLNSILNNKTNLEHLEKELFYITMCKLFGENGDPGDLVQHDKNIINQEIFNEKII
ncbi:unnamed protein product [Brachionus calyciflorus]|uniref:Uncharacterized protein n=1 Tax=Brachionus calyciflorus TaxID=104777 RepID=A0A814A6K8_9BILA|nr:unnamed protein product [Brachionus calyciflorus]